MAFVSYQPSTELAFWLDMIQKKMLALYLTLFVQEELRA
jgi:hypothetical protein